VSCVEQRGNVVGLMAAGSLDLPREREARLDWGGILSDQQISELIAYLKTLR
jgi:hypothetical protein